ncbi:host specificity protein J [Erwinia aphidicola]|uniref:host specificity protein J n=1 Tax=Erwinia aphidicola TaxID=68334 RepID=UPI00300C18BF
MQITNGVEFIHGRKGGGGTPHTPYEQPDDLLSTAKLKMLLAVAEGEIEGELTAQDILLNDTQLANDDGSYNFTGVVWDYRKGTQDQTYIQGMPEIDNEMAVGIEVKQNTPWTRQLTKLDLDAVRIKLSLPRQYLYKDNGDMVGTVTEYAIDLSTDGGAWKEVVKASFKGKTTSEYQRDHRINLPKATSLWAIRVRRITPDSQTPSKLMNAFNVYSYAEVVDSKLRYPNTALLYVEFDAAQFNGNAPKVTCRPKGRRIRVPSNYNPVTREYTGAWDGNFVWAFSNNPAWIFYDLVLNKIFGMGNRVDASMIDKWELYSIAAYCDEKVSNGAGGTEPRFTCNVYIQSQQDAYNVLKDIAAIFRGITFWGNNQIFVNADIPQVNSDGHVDPDWTYTAANVINGLFTTAGGSYKNRYSSCQVSYSDPQNHFTDTVETVYDSELVARYGVQEMQLTAIGCTSQSEAHRRGRWALLTNAKDGSISFGVGLDGHIPLPASIIAVADPFLAGRQNGGRIHAVNGRSVTLDRVIDYAAGDRLILNTTDGKTQTRTIGAISEDKRTITVSTAWASTPVAGAVWSIDSDDLAVQYYRVTSVMANDDGTFTISGVQHDPNKFRYIDDGVRIESPPVTVTPIAVMKPPANIKISENSFASQGLSVASMEVSWDKAEGAIRYMAQWRKDNGDWVNVGQTSATGFSIQGIYAGVYDVRVRSVNAADVSSPWGNAETTTLNGKVGKPGTPVSLVASTNVVWNIDVTWAFPAGSGDTAYTELQVATTADGQNPQFLTYVPYPGVSYQHGPMPAGVRRWYRARLVDKIGNVGDWTAFVGGATNSSASELIDDVVEEFLTSPDGQALLDPLITDPEAAMKDILAGYDNVNQQWSQYGENRAGIIEASKVATDAQSSVASLATVVTANYNNQQAAIQQKFDAYADVDNPSAIYTLKTGIRYNGANYDAGLSVAATVNGTSVDTRVAVNANQFVVISGAQGNYYSPFIIKDGQVLINQAFIGTAWIGRGNITDVLQSDNYVAGQSGLSLNFKTGVIENYGSTAGEGKMKQTNQTISVADGNGRLRVQIGRITGAF